MRILLTLQYLGTRYAGWQTQANAIGVQTVVEDALTKMFGAPVKIEGAGRTDAGVHARAQKAHADIPFDIPRRGFLLGINDLLPHDIRVTAIDDCPDAFHCRFDAKLKTYQYRIWNGPVADVFAFETHAFVAQQLDVARMQAAADLLRGTHDFRVFTVAEPEVSSTERTITAIRVEREGQVIRIEVTADGFLRFMVRRIAGSLIEAGRGKLEPARIFDQARWTAPAKGLILWDIRYADNAAEAG